MDELNMIVRDGHSMVDDISFDTSGATVAPRHMDPAEVDSPHVGAVVDDDRAYVAQSYGIAMRMYDGAGSPCMSLHRIEPLPNGQPGVGAVADACPSAVVQLVSDEAVVEASGQHIGSSDETLPLVESGEVVVHAAQCRPAFPGGPSALVTLWTAGFIWSMWTCAGLDRRRTPAVR